MSHKLLLFCVAVLWLSCISNATTRVPVRTPAVLVEQYTDTDDIIVIDSTSDSDTIKLEPTTTTTILSTPTPTTTKTHSTTRHPYKPPSGVPLQFDAVERDASAWFAQCQAVMRNTVSPGKLVMIICGVLIALFYAVGEVRKIYRARRLLRRGTRTEAQQAKRRVRDRKKAQ